MTVQQSVSLSLKSGVPCYSSTVDSSRVPCSVSRATGGLKAMAMMIPQILDVITMDVKV